MMLNDAKLGSFDDATGPARVRAAVDAHGYAIVHAPELVAAAAHDPWAAARRLWGGAVLLVEAHPIHPIPGGRSFAANAEPTPLHTDSQSFRGVPPRIQVMLCRRRAASGGETLLLDSWALLARIEAEQPKLWRALLTRPRRIPFVFGDVWGPTVSLRGGSVVFTHSPMPASDELGRRLAAWIEQAELVERRVEADELLVVDNHRMLHGRRGFADPERRFLRLLVWTREPSSPPIDLRQAVTEAHEQLARTLRRQPPALREPWTGVAAPTNEAEQRLAIVLELLRGTSPGMLAHRCGVPERELYRWRDAALRAASEALEQLPSASDQLARLERLRRKLS